MDYEQIVQAICTVGFPIVMCLIMQYNNIKQDELHREETKNFTQALNSNTLVLQKICDKLDIKNGE